MIEDIKSKFSKNLFWDINICNLDMEKHARYIIGRVLELRFDERLALYPRILRNGTAERDFIEYKKHVS